MPSHTQKEKKVKLLEIQPHFPQLAHSRALVAHIRKAKEILQELIPEEFFLFPRGKQKNGSSINSPLSIRMIPKALQIASLFISSAHLHKK